MFGPNWIAVTNNGSVGHAYFMSHQYTSSHDVTSLYLPDREISEQLGLFLVKLLERAGEPFSYARKWRPIRLRKTPIYLPITDTGIPDWSFMEEYVRLKTKKIKEAYPLPKQHEITDYRELDEVEWGEFFVDDLINVKSGVRLTKDQQADGRIPFIGASDNNNGITGFVTNINSSTENNTLGVNYNGSIGHAFLSRIQSNLSDDVKKLNFKSGDNNKYTLLFLKHVIERQAKKFAYGYKFNGQRMRRQIIKLPIKSHGNPDFTFMEQYMKRMENRIIQKMEQ